MTVSGHITTGITGEKIAEEHLRKKGFRTVCRNWRPKGRTKNLELDLVGEWEGYLVFAEVKARRPNPEEDENFPPGLKNFSVAKQKNMVKAAKVYLTEHEAWDKACQFDLLCITFLPGKPPMVEHYANVIELGQTLDSSNASWQPW
jgi:putative endonuclease